MMTRKRLSRALFIGLLFAALLVGWRGLYEFRLERELEPFESIEVGMTRAEVVARVGREPDDVDQFPFAIAGRPSAPDACWAAVYRFRIWKGVNIYYFDSADRVVGRSYMTPPLY
jgi:hypothetical protein